MATPYEAVYERFLPKLTDYSFANLTQEEMEASIQEYLKSAIVKFTFCRKDLYDRDDLLKQFNEDLTGQEIEIIANLMIIDYLMPKLISADLLQQTLNSKDFKLYSQANHIKEIRNLRDMLKNETDRMMMNYNYYKRSLDGLL